MTQMYAYPIGPPTKEDLDNAMLYGICWVCRQPRRRFHHSETIDGLTTHTMGMTCPNNCNHDSAVDEHLATLDNSRPTG